MSKKIKNRLSLTKSRSSEDVMRQSSIVYYEYMKRNPHLDLCDSPDRMDPLPVSPSISSSYLALAPPTAANLCPTFNGPNKAMAARSLSVTSMNSEGSMQDVAAFVDEESIVKLTRDVRTFKETLGKLKRIFSVDRDKLEKSRVAAHESLGEVLRILQGILQKHPKLKSTELLQTAEAVIRQVKGFRFEDEKADSSEFLGTVDQLALAFSSCVSEFLMGDLDSSNQNSSKTRSCDNLLNAEVDGPDSCHAPISAPLNPKEIDAVMMKSPQGVEVALHHAKVWSKYAKDLTLFIERYCNNWTDYAKNLAKLVQSSRPVLTEGTFMPFQSIYCTSLDQDLEYSNTIIATCNLLLGHKYIEPLLARRNEHDRVRKHLKDTWQRELKRMQEAVSNLRKSKALYIQRQQDYEKARDSLQKLESTSQGNDLTDSNKIDKKRKLKEDNLQKALEAETTYKACVVEANERRQQLDKVKGEVLKQVRELIYQCDQTMKAVTVGYFQLQHTVSAQSPVQYQTLCESSRLYEPGLQYMERVKRQPFTPQHHSSLTNTASNVQSSSQAPLYVFEPYNSERLQDKSQQSHDPGGDYDDPSSDGNKTRHLSASNKGWSGNYPTNSSDSDSIESANNRSRDPSPTASPQISSHENKVSFGINISSGDELENDLEAVTNNVPQRQAMSKAAVTHTFRKLKTPSRCRECDSYVYFQGAECTECGLSCHKKCLEALAIQCGHKRLPRKMTTFGVELATHLLDTNTGIPPIVAKCVSELETRGIEMRGIYRLSGVKSRVEKLCQTFESGMELVDASGVHPSVVANVLKLYLRQLPEPLLTFRLYKDFVNSVKSITPGSDLTEVIDELKRLVQLLPIPYYKTLAVLMHHLKKVSELCELNNMPSTNLGIIFGPTLLRTREGTASLNSLVDTVHQAKVIELLIDNVMEVFGPEYKKIEPLRPKRSNVSTSDVPCEISIDEGEPKKVKEELEGKIDTVDTAQDLDEENLATESNSSSEDLKDISVEVEETQENIIQEDSLDSPTLNHPAFSRNSATRIEHRRHRISDRLMLSELSKEPTIQHQALVQRKKSQRCISVELQDLDTSKADESPSSPTNVQLSFPEKDESEESSDLQNVHQKLQKASSQQSAISIAAQNAHLRSKFFGDASDENKNFMCLSKSQSSSAVTSQQDSVDSDQYSVNRFGKGKICLPTTCLVPNPQSVNLQADTSISSQKYELSEKLYSSRKLFNSNSSELRKSSSGLFSQRSKSPDVLNSPVKSRERPFSFSPLESNSMSTRIETNSHRTIYRTSGLNHRGVDSSSESLSSEQSSRYSLKNKFHTPIHKTKSSGSSDGYAEDEEMEEVTEKFESSSSLNTQQQNNDNRQTFV